MSVRTLTAYISAFLLLLFPTGASAHSFGVLYNLPVPFWLYLYGGAGAIIASFIIISYLVHMKELRAESREFIFAGGVLNFVNKRWFTNSAKALAAAFFLLTILSGLFGDNNSYTNINMTVFWIIFMLGFTYLTALVGDMYRAINPIRSLVEWVESIGWKVNPVMDYPKRLSYYPALIFYFLFIYIELFEATSPFSLSLFILQYLLFSIIGVMLWGKENWFKYCDFFGVFFKLIGSLSILHARDGKIYLRPPFSGLLKEKIENFSELLFILFMLSSTAFDGFSETRVFYDIYDWLRFIPFRIFDAGILILSPFLFLGIYTLLIWLTKIIARSAISIKELLLRFAPSLIPIAVAYNVAHYYTLIITEGQKFISLISDPFGFGWNLFGTAGFEPNISLADANITWHAQVAIILLGHIAGVYMAHAEAIKTFQNGKNTILSQVPMLLLMVTYTMAGLWILSQPITSGL